MSCDTMKLQLSRHFCRATKIFCRATRASCCVELTCSDLSTFTRCHTRTFSFQVSFEDIINTHDTFMKSLGIELSDDAKRLPYLYWTPKLHKSPVKHRFIAASSKYTTKQLSSLLTKLITVIKTGLEKYCSIKSSHTGVNKYVDT